MTENENANLELDQQDKIVGHIYKITNIKNDKIYVGQAQSHRKNKGMYRVFGYMGRFKDHISEALNNTKTKQCTYLNNAIRKYGKDQFKCELLEICDRSLLDEKEIEYIEKCKSLYPNGYNLTKGGKLVSEHKVLNNEPLNKPKKRGREFGYKHTEETMEKFKISNKIGAKKREKYKEKYQDNMSTNISNYYINYKIQKLSQYELDKTDLKKYIRPVKNKNTGEIHKYEIHISREVTYEFTSKKYSLEETYDMLHDILIKSQELREKNAKSKQ